MVKKVGVVLVLFIAVFLGYVFVRLYYPKYPYSDGQLSYISNTDWEFATIRPYYLWEGKRGNVSYVKVVYLESNRIPVVSDVFIGGELDGKYIENVSVYDNGKIHSWEEFKKDFRIGDQTKFDYLTGKKFLGGGSDENSRFEFCINNPRVCQMYEYATKLLNSYRGKSYMPAIYVFTTLNNE